MRISSTIIISDFLQTVRSGTWTPFEAATALKAALKKEGYVILPRKEVLEMMQPGISRDLANWEI
jgi:hypothetical protein